MPSTADDVFVVVREGEQNLILHGPHRDSFKSDDEFEQAKREWADIGAAFREGRDPCEPC